MSVPSRTEAAPAPALELLELRKVFKGRRRAQDVVAVRDVSFQIARGEVLGLVGESGSGKSTIARLVAHLHEPSGGEIHMAGQGVPLRLRGGALRKFRKRVQMIFQDPYASLNPLNTVGYILSRPLQIHGMTGGDAAKAVLTLLDRVGLSPPEVYAAKRPFELSGGQRQRVGIARALAPRPEIILADEPTSALDVSIRLDIMNLLLDLKDQEGLSMLFITHDLAGARYMSDRVAVLYAGTLVEIGPATSVIDAPQHPYTVLLRSAAPKPDAGLVPDRVEGRGEIPDLTQLPPGCPFEPRCPHAMPECSAGLPRMYEVAPGHLSRCLLHDPAVMASRGGVGLPAEAAPA